MAMDGDSEEEGPKRKLVVPLGEVDQNMAQGKRIKTYEARMRFGTQVWVQDSAIFKKGGCGCSGTWQLKNY